MALFKPTPPRQPTHIFTTCPWCHNPKACLENPDYPRGGDVLQGICRSCSGLFSINKHLNENKE
jgi:hypothetical protein